MKSTLISTFLVMLALSRIAPGSPNIHKPITLEPILDGTEMVNAPVISPPYSSLTELGDFDNTDETFPVGTTWYESQANGTVGHKIDVDSAGNVHLVWMNGLDAGASNRHIYYNEVYPSGQLLFPAGAQVDADYRAGYPCLDTRYGNLPFIWYHAVVTSSSPSMIFTQVNGIDFPAPSLGANISSYWPQAQWGYGTNPRFHILCQEFNGTGSPQHQFYIGGTYNPNTFQITYDPSWTEFEPSQTIAYIVATSRTTNKVAIAWTHCREPGYPGQPGQTFTQMNNDVYLVMDDDGQNISFANPLNVTQFIGPDSSLLPDTLHADKDTLRAYTDIALFVDHNNYVHCAFTTRAYFSFEQTTYWNASLIWHWCSQYPDSFRMIANAFNPNDMVNCGVWQVKAQRPSLGEGPAPNYWLYCAYHRYDTDSTHLSAAGWPSGEVYISVSTTNGLTWSSGVNVTNTLTPYLAQPGQCLSEICPSMAETVNFYCHLMYILDKDAGNVVQSEGSWTLNPVIYYRVLTSLIPTTPLLPQIYNLHGNPGWPFPDITLTPYGMPIVIPPSGGSFNFNVAVSNGWTMPQTTMAWCMIKLPSGSYFGPTIGPVTLTLPGGGSINRNRTQYVPGRAPSGSYQYLGYTGVFPNIKIDSSFFPFSKSGVSVGDGAQDWLSSGESFGTTDVGARRASPLQPEELDLSIHPNPFNPTTAICYQLQTASRVSLRVYDTAGRLVETLVDGWLEVGEHKATFDASELPSGIYFVRLAVVEQAVVQKMILLK